jgi:hypothetical protein
MATLQNTTINDTGFIKVPSGTAAQGTGDVVEYFTSTGPATFNVPTGVTSVWVLAVAGGGGGGAFPTSYGGGGGGAGGYVEVPTYPVTPGGTVALAVGAGGAAGTNNGTTTQYGYGTLSSIFDAFDISTTTGLTYRLSMGSGGAGGGGGGAGGGGGDGGGGGGNGGGVGRIGGGL